MGSQWFIMNCTFSSLFSPLCVAAANTNQIIDTTTDWVVVLMMATLPRKYLLISPKPSLQILFRVSSSRIHVIGCVIQKRCTYIKSILETVSVCKKCVFKTLISCKIEMFFFILCSTLCSPYYLCAIFHFKNFRSGGYDVTTNTSTNFTESFPMC